MLPDASFSISWITQAPEGFVSFTLQRGRGMILDWSPPNRGSQTRPPPFGSGSAHSDFGGGQSQVQSDFIVHPAGQRPLQTGWASSDAVTTPRPIPPRTANETTPAKTNFLTSTSFLARLPWGIRERQPQEGPAEGFGATSATLRPHHLPVVKHDGTTDTAYLHPPQIVRGPLLSVPSGLIHTGGAGPRSPSSTPLTIRASRYPTSSTAARSGLRLSLAPGSLSAHEVNSRIRRSHNSLSIGL